MYVKNDSHRCMFMALQAKTNSLPRNAYSLTIWASAAAFVLERDKHEERTIVNCMDYLYYVKDKKYNYFEKSHKIMFRLSPCIKYVYDLSCVFVYRIVRQLCNYAQCVNVFGHIWYIRIAIDVLTMVFINIMFDNITPIDASML